MLKSNKSNMIFSQFWCVLFNFILRSGYCDILFCFCAKQEESSLKLTPEDEDDVDDISDTIRHG